MHDKLLAFMAINKITKISLADLLGYSYVGIRKKFDMNIPFNTKDAKTICNKYNKKFEELF